MLIPMVGLGQIGGSNSFNTLNLMDNARSAGLGNRAISLADGDITQFMSNPATLDSINGNSLAVMINPYFVDVNIYNGIYAFKFKDFNVGVGLTYLSYGDFELNDASGETLGTFVANDYQASVGVSHRLGSISLGANITYLNSTIYDFSTSALAVDFGGVFQINPNWSFGMVIENLGIVLVDPSGIQNLPLDVRLGTTFKPNYMPFRFTLTSNAINGNNLSRQSGNLDLPNSSIDQILRRFSIGTEVLFSDNFQLLFGYNHNRKQELRLDQSAEGAGFSYGLMLKVNRFKVRFSRMTYHASGGTSLISIQTDLNDFKNIL